jgi:hypothetical protein
MVSATGRLADSTDLSFSSALLGEDGYPDDDKVRAAIDDLLTKKPHLASSALLAMWVRARGRYPKPCRSPRCCGRVRAR